jgi:hypothetical protein
MKKLLFLFLLGLSPAAAQSVLQAGPMTPGHAPMYNGAFGQSQAVIQDSGPASGGGQGTGLSELGLTVRGTGAPPYANAGTGPYGANWCDYDAPITNSTGYHYICLSPNAQGGESIIAGFTGSTGGIPLQFIINGVVTPINSAGNLLPTNNTWTGTNLWTPSAPAWSTYTTQYLPDTFNINNLPAASMFAGLGTPGGYTSGGQTTGLVGAVDTPSTDTALLEPGGVSGNVNVGVAGVCRTASTVKGCVGGAFVGEANANGVSTFGLSVNATNFPYGNGTAAGFNSGTWVGIDLTVLANAPSSGSLTGLLEGMRIYGALGSGATAPSGGLIGIEIGGTGNTSIGWGSAIFIDPSPSTAAISISQAGSASTQASQSINFSNKVGGTVYQSVIYEDASAVFEINTYAGELVNVNGAPIAQINSSGLNLESGVLQIPQVTWTDTETCTAGQFTADANYIYFCTTTNTVKRAALSTF